MSQDTLLTIFVGVSAVALCIQLAMLVGMYLAISSIRQQVLKVMPQVGSILTKTEATVDQSKKNIIEITEKTNEIMDMAKTQMIKIDSVVTDATSRAKVQLERAEMVVDDTVNRVHSSVNAVHNGILRPIREINGVATGVKTAMQHFMRGNRPSVAQVTQDDEMFI